MRWRAGELDTIGARQLGLDLSWLVTGSADGPRWNGNLSAIIWSLFTLQAIYNSLLKGIDRKAKYLPLAGE